MIIRKAQVSATGDNYSGVVTLVLVEKEDGWTYEVEGMNGDNLPLTWRARTPQKATEKIKDIYRSNTWKMEIL